MTAALTPPPWAADALCAQVDPDLWFPMPGGSNRDAKAICRRCPVQAECLEYGMTDPHGIYGGMSESERTKIRRARLRMEVAA